MFSAFHHNANTALHAQIISAAAVRVAQIGLTLRDSSGLLQACIAENQSTCCELMLHAAQVKWSVRLVPCALPMMAVYQLASNAERATVAGITKCIYHLHPQE